MSPRLSAGIPSSSAPHLGPESLLCNVSDFILSEKTLKRFHLFIFKEKEGEGERRETLIGYLMHKPQLGAGPATQAFALIGNRTGDLSLCETGQHSNQG